LCVHFLDKFFEKKASKKINNTTPLHKNENFYSEWTCIVNEWLRNFSEKLQEGRDIIDFVDFTWEHTERVNEFGQFISEEENTWKGTDDSIAIHFSKQYVKSGIKSVLEDRVLKDFLGEEFYKFQV